MDFPSWQPIKRNRRPKTGTNPGGAPMPLEIKRLHLAKLSPPGGERGQWPVHGFGRVRSISPSRVHFCHHTDVVHD
jgi:hypothetical protein